MTCSSAPKLAYGSAHESSSTFVNYTCNAGYSMQGSPYIECSNGVWNMTDYPICLSSLEQYSNASMSYHADSNTTTDTSAEFSTWFVYGMMGSGGCLALAVAAFCLLACCHICGCCPGPVVAVGGRYQYSDRRWYSVFSWCDFIVKGKVCRKIRNMNKSKTIGPASVILDVEDETSTTGDKTDELEKEKDDQPPGDADSESQINDAEKEKDVSSSTSGYASSSPSSSPLPEEESLLPDNENMPNGGTLNGDKNKQSPRDSDDTVVINIEEEDDSKTTPTDEKPNEVSFTNGKTKQSQSDSDNTGVASAVNTKNVAKDVSSTSLPEKEPLLPGKKRVATKAQRIRTKPKTKQSRPTSDNAELPNNEKPDSKATPTDKPATNKTVKPKTKQIKKSKK